MRTTGRGPFEITSQVAAVVRRSGIETGLCTTFVQHTSASLVIQENADPSVQRDLAAWLERLAPEGSHYDHDAEGPDDMPSHLRAVLMNTSENVPVQAGRLALGTWQGIFVWEHRRVAHTRHVVVHVLGL